MVVGFCGILLFLFVPESYWDRTPVPKSRKQSMNGSIFSLFSYHRESRKEENDPAEGTSKANNDHANLKKEASPGAANGTVLKRPALARRQTTNRVLHVGFASQEPTSGHGGDGAADDASPISDGAMSPLGKEFPGKIEIPAAVIDTDDCLVVKRILYGASTDFGEQVTPRIGPPPLPGLHNFNSPWYNDVERDGSDYITAGQQQKSEMNIDGGSSFPLEPPEPAVKYTTSLKNRPQLTFIQTLKPFNGRLHHDNWFRVAVRPFILFAYPSVLWSAVVYSCSVGWLIVLSESVAVIYRSRTTYGFSALSTGLIYISPFIGGILGTAVAGKVSDIIVQAMSKRNGGLYEPEFRLVMAIPITISTVIGLMGFGWSAHDHDAWIVPTLFFGIISFGCSLGSTTAITFCVDSYRQYAGEALVTLNFSKNIFHGLVFSLFFTTWLENDGSKTVFIYVGIIQLILMAFSIPMYIFGKRARMWTVRKNLMEKF
jgi:hypothetical protein